MSLDPITALLDVGKMAIERIWPDPSERAKQEIALAELAQKGTLEELAARVGILKGQMAVNAKEAEHKSVFVAGWRPFIGWVCGFGIAYAFLIYPLLGWVWNIVDIFVDMKGVKPPPQLETEELMTLLLGMLGLAAHRSYDKRQKTATNSIKGK